MNHARTVITMPPRAFAYSLFLIFAYSLPALAAWQPTGIPTQQLAEMQTIPAPGISTTVSAPASSYFNITAEDAGKAVADQLVLQAVEKKAEVSLAAGSPRVLYSADHPLKIVIHSLQVDPNAKRWQAQAYILSGGKTETVQPISGTYIAMIDVPVLTRQLGRNDVIAASDLTTKAFPDRQLRKETVTDMAQLVGQSPRAVISMGRPIRLNELSAPIVIKKGDAVQMTYTNKYMSIKATGIALQDGAKGELIRIKNDKSGKAVSGRVESAGHIEVNNSAM